MIAVYLTLIAIPLIYNNRYIKENARSKQNNNDSYYRRDLKPLRKSVIILLNNLNDDQLESVLKIANLSPRRIDDEKRSNI